METRSRSSLWLWCGLTCLVCLSATRIVLLACSFSASDSTEDPAFVGPPATHALELRTVADTLGRDDSIYLSLKRNGVPKPQIARLDRALRSVFDSRSESRPGDTFTLTVNNSGVVERFEYAPRSTPERPVLVERVGEELVGRRPALPLVTRTVAVEVLIEDNLANAVRAAGETDALTDVLADNIYGATIDFRLQPRAGDRLGLVFEKVYTGDDFVRYGRVLLARYEGQIVSQTAVRYDLPDGAHDYYDGEGKSLSRTFLLYALPYRGITSRFNRQRLHPVLKRTLPHLGTDYAASTGTRVWATAQGKVVFAGTKGALGKAVIIQHPNGYITRYGHLSRILVRKGQRIAQQQLVGHVGATGRVTGPHLHYEVIKDGGHLNPESINRGAKGRPLAQEHLAAFRTQRDALLAVLDRSLHSPAGPIADAHVWDTAAATD